MKRTIQGIAIGVVGCLLIALGSAAMMAEARNEALRNKINWQAARIFDLTIEIVALKTTENNCKTLQYHLPEICLNELSRVAFRIEQIKDEIQQRKREAR
ncbi:hypothetical protein KAR91_07685 [Candidatus Pacearchaeota archaeon]|nr:hypothetical protein [Candidatus Pacearchaeota archaeon]